MTQFLITTLHHADLILCAMSDAQGAGPDLSDAMGLIEDAMDDASDADICNDVFIPLDADDGGLVLEFARANGIYHIVR